MNLLLIGIAGTGALLWHNGKKQKRQSSPNQLVPHVEDPYFPKETGYTHVLARRIPQYSYVSGNVVGDISPLNPIPFSSNVKEVRDINITQWAMPPINRKKQLALIIDKEAYHEHPRHQTFMHIPQGKKRHRKHAFYY